MPSTTSHASTCRVLDARVWLAVVLVLAACGGSQEPPPNDGYHRQGSVTRTAPAPFLDIPGLTSVTEQRYVPDEWGSNIWSHMIVSRGDKVVCDVQTESFGGHENHSYRDTANLELSSREPLRFHIMKHSVSNDVGEMSSCSGFEIPRSGMCRQLFERNCTYERCSAHLSTNRRIPGSGTIKGRVTFEGEQVIAASVVVGPQSAISDDQGAFVVEAGPGTHELEIYGSPGGTQRVTVTLAPTEDATIAIAIRCAQADDRTCCSF